MQTQRRTNERTHARSLLAATLSLALQRILHQRCMASASSPPAQDAAASRLRARAWRSTKRRRADFIPIPANRRVFRACAGGSVAERVWGASHQWLPFRACTLASTPAPFPLPPSRFSDDINCLAAIAQRRPRGDCSVATLQPNLVPARRCSS